MFEFQTRSSLTADQQCAAVGPVQSLGQMLFLVTMLTLAVGCSSQAEQREFSRSSQATSYEHDHERDHDRDDKHEHAHDHEHEHHGAHSHDDPEHKPVDFPAAVERLKQLRAELAGDEEAASGNWQIAVDIVDWLPELAAESEIGEADWNRVDGSTIVLREILARRTPSSADWARFDSELERLNVCVGVYQAAEAKFLRRLGAGTVMGEE